MKTAAATLALLLLAPCVLAQNANDRRRQEFSNSISTARTRLQDTAARLDFLGIVCIESTTWTNLAAAYIAPTHKPEHWRAASARDTYTREQAQNTLRAFLFQNPIHTESAAFERRTRRALESLTPAELIGLRTTGTLRPIPTR